MLNLIFAPSADTLVTLAEKQIGQAWSDPFDPPVIIVPNPAVKKWLTIKLAAPNAFGCVAGLQMFTLEKFLWGALGGKQGATMLNAKHLSHIVCAILDDDVLSEKIYRPLKNYLCSSDGKVDALKRVQLSLKIATQFIEYEYNRPSVWIEKSKNWKHGIDASWLAGKNYFDDSPHESWQKDLYYRVYDRLSKSDLITLPHLYRTRREECAKKNEAWCNIDPNKDIVLFGVSKISHFHRNTLVEISQVENANMHVFLTNPCAEFWEDVDTSRRAIRRKWKHDSPSELAGIKPVKSDDYAKSELSEITLFSNIENDHKLLKLWGGAGKENIFLWCPLALWNFAYYTDDDLMIDELTRDDNQTSSQSNNTLLKSIQKSLLNRTNDLDTSNINLQNDNSIQILACPDIGREVEELREMILDLAHKKQITAFNEIAVYVPDTNKYLPHIQRVFGAYPHGHPDHIPFAVINAHGGTSLAAHALATLIDIASGQYNRAKIFELLRNPIVWSSKEISPDDVDVWETWAEDFGMYRGFDATSRKRMGDMGESATDAHTFKRGVEQVFIKISEDENQNLQDENQSHKESAEQFLLLLQELNELMLSFTDDNDTSKKLDIRESINNITNAVWSWLGCVTDDGVINSAAEVRVRKDAINGLAQILLQCDLAGRETMCAAEFFAHVRNTVATETAVTHSAWNGVTFAPLRAAMVLPHRAIFALGLDAADFPGVADSGSWNLLTGKRIIGDSDTVRDNRFAFLELIHAAKEKLTLSYRSRNMQKDEALQPSSVIMELEEFLISHEITDSDATTRRSAVHHDISWIVHETLYDVATRRKREHGSWDKVQRELAQLADVSLNKRVKHRHALATRTRKEDAQSENIQIENVLNFEVDIRDIKQFLKNPLEYHLRKTLKINDNENFGGTAISDEPLKSEGIHAAQLRKNVWRDILIYIFSDDVDKNNLENNALQFANKRYAEHIESGLAPEGHACRMEQKSLAEWSKIAAAKSEILLEQFPNHKLVEEHEFKYSCKQFNINGKYPLIILPKDENDKTQNIGVVSFTKKTKIAENLELFTDGALQWIYEFSGATSSRNITLIQLDRGDKPKIEFTRLTSSHDKFTKMENWLQNILSQMLIEKRCEHLPFKTIAELTNKLSIDELTIDLLKEKIETYKTFTDGFDLTDAILDDVNNDNLREIIKARYAPIAERWIYE